MDLGCSWNLQMVRMRSQDQSRGPIRLELTCSIGGFYHCLSLDLHPRILPTRVLTHRCLIPVFLVCNCAFFFSSLMIIGLFIADFLLICSLSRIILMSVRLSCALWELQFLSLKDSQTVCRAPVSQQLAGVREDHCFDHSYCDSLNVIHHELTTTDVSCKNDVIC